MKNEKKYRFLISSIDAFGHINCSLALGEILASYGHEVTFTNRLQYKKLADRRNFKFIPFDERLFENVQPSSAAEWFDGYLHKFRVDPLSIFKDWTTKEIEIFGSILNVYKQNNIALEAIFRENADNFDLFIGDFVVMNPVFHRAPFPCAFLLSMNPIPLYPDGPPAWSGFPVNEKDPEKWNKFRDLFGEASKAYRDNLFTWWRSHGVPLPDVNNVRIESWWYAEPDHLGIYHYPQLLDYTEIGPIRSDKWVRLDCAIRKSDNVEPFIIPESLKALPGKLIYFSLGTLGSVQLDLMRKFIEILSKCPHRFIVSKGPKGNQLELGPNMWGENYVNQIAVLDVVDLVITHGGNNTFLETIYAGKPLIVIPFFMDQFDNAQRAVDCGIGHRINLYEIDEIKVLQTIEETLSNPSYAEKIVKVADSMKSEKNREKTVKRIESFIENYKNECKNQRIESVN